MNAFQGSWIVALVVLVGFATVIGYVKTPYGLTGILVDQRGRYSLNRLQLTMWTLLVLSTLLGWFFSSAFQQLLDRPEIEKIFGIPSTLLTLMGISVGSATVAGAVKNTKDAQGVTQQAGAIPTGVAQVPSKLVQQRMVTDATSGAKKIKRHFSQVFLQEEGSQIDQVIDLAKFQNFIFTIVLGITYVVLLWQLKPHGYPDLNDSSGQGHILWLLGVSHAGYVGGKLPTKA